jgi:hypothetical protein
VRLLERRLLAARLQAGADVVAAVQDHLDLVAWPRVGRRSTSMRVEPPQCSRASAPFTYTRVW